MQYYCEKCTSSQELRFALFSSASKVYQAVPQIFGYHYTLFLGGVNDAFV